MRFFGIVLLAACLCGGSFAASPKPSPEGYYADSVEAEELLKRKEFERARAILERLVQRDPQDSSTWIAYAIALGGLHRDEEAIAAAKKGVEIGVLSERYTFYEIAKIYARDGRREQAFDYLERALARRFTPRTQIQHESLFQPFASDERFRRLSGQLPPRDFSRDEGWRYDITFLVEEARRLHPSPSREAFSAEFERAAKTLSNAVPTLSETQMRVKMQALITLLHDGHSGIDMDQDTQRLPLRFYFFADGVFVIGASDGDEALIGSRVIRIGSRPIEELLRELPQYVPRDNAMGVKWRGPRTLEAMEFLQALGAADSLGSATLTLEGRNGKPRVVKVRSVPAADRELVGLLPPAHAAAPAPLYLQRLSTVYWFAPVTAETLYLQFNGVYNMPGQSIAEFADALEQELGKGAVQNVIVDVRLNPGGDLGLYPPLLRVLAGFRASSPRRQIFCIIGRNTFSAAQAFIGDLERFVAPVFVGEPSGSSPNFTGESTGWFELPYSHIRVNISERYHQHSAFPDDGRQWIAPRIPVELTSNDYFSNRDPVLEAVLAVLRSG